MIEKFIPPLFNNLPFAAWILNTYSIFLDKLVIVQKGAGLIGCFQGYSKEFLTVFIASLPISELRGAIPFALGMKLPVLKAYFLAVLGNLVPVIPLLLFFGEVVRILERFMWGKKFLNWLFTRTRTRSQIIQRFEIIGLTLFVAVPLPLTGAWSGAVAAFIFGIRFRYAILAITLGVLIAGVIVTLVSLGSIGFLNFLIH